MSVVGCYTLHLYCDHPGHKDFMHGNDWTEYSPMCFCRNDRGHPGPDDYGNMGQYTGRTFQQCGREARRDGWIINEKSDRAICPHHSGKKPKGKDHDDERTRNSQS